MMPAIVVAAGLAAALAVSRQWSRRTPEIPAVEGPTPAERTRLDAELERMRDQL
jgi:hypothetical protein